MEVVNFLGLAPQHPDTYLGVGIIIGFAITGLVSSSVKLFNKYISIG